MLTNSAESYGLVSKLLHWLMMLMILSMIGVGLYMTELDKQDPWRLQIYNLHKSIGVLLLMLVAIRILWLRISQAPAVPAVLKTWEKVLSKIVIGLMYLLMLAIPISGYVLTVTKGYAVNFFGLYELPSLLGKSEHLHELAEELHEYLSYGLLGLVGLHMLGSFKHRLLDTEPEADVLKRML